MRKYLLGLLLVCFASCFSQKSTSVDYERRVGFEDSDMIAPGVHCDTNAAIIADLVDIIKSKGMMPMTPAEARAMLGRPQLKK